MFLLLLFSAICAFAADREIPFPASSPSRPIPLFDRGYVVEIRQPQLTVSGPDGMRRFDATIHIDGRPEPQIMKAAVDSDGTLVVGLAWSTGGGLAMLDANGGLTSFIDTGNFMPANLCIDPNHSIWAFGWERDQVANDGRAARSGFMQVRRFAREGKNDGAFLPRDLFPRGLAPGAMHGGFWSIHAAKDRVGMMAFPGMVANAPAWVELDLQGT